MFEAMFDELLERYKEYCQKTGRVLDTWEGKNLLEAYKIEHLIMPSKRCKECGKINLGA
jgi:hypothetical protein